MIAQLESVKAALDRKLSTLEQQGYDIAVLGDDPVASISGYDNAVALADQFAALPMRADWPFVEPDSLEEIEAVSDIESLSPESPPDDDTIRDKIRAGFLGSVCGCILGKPVEMRPDMAMLQEAATAVGDWPLNDYVTEEMMDNLPRRNWTWVDTVRDKITFAAPDDDINYTIIGMLLLEQHGVDLAAQDVLEFWLSNLPAHMTFGPERTTITLGALDSLHRGDGASYERFERWNHGWNSLTELCGAQIRADAYGYAFPGDPISASRLAYADASLTHRKTGVYSTMFTSSAIALAFTTEDPLDIFRKAAMVVPRQSRFRQAVERCIEMVDNSTDWLGGYQAIHGAYNEYGHCMVLQETGTLINSLRYGEEIADTFCKQVMQGNDTDSYGATAGALAGIRFGSPGLDQRWLDPFQNTIHTTIATFHDQSLTSVAERMSLLPWRIGQW